MLVNGTVTVPLAKIKRIGPCTQSSRRGTLGRLPIFTDSGRITRSHVLQGISRISIKVFVDKTGRTKPDSPVECMDFDIRKYDSLNLEGYFFSSIGELSRAWQCSHWWRCGMVPQVLLEEGAESAGQDHGKPPRGACEDHFTDISKATNNFHHTMMLGTGAFGAVYRCKLHCLKGQSMEVAVKKFTRSDTRCYEDFLAEVSIINRLRHKNIVPLIGWSYRKGEPLLIYEYMTNGSLDRHIFRRASTTSVLQQKQRTGTAMEQWGTRYNIVSDIVTGLHYVHHEYEPMVLHRDVKASNILLDSSFHARLGDFGLACTVAGNRNSFSGDVAGTFGYIASDYAMNCKATKQTDIYAFGVLVLEIVTGRKAMLNDAQFVHITDWVWHLHHRGRLLEAVDSVLGSAIHGGEFEMEEEPRRLLLLGLACSNPNPSDRPTMVEAVQVIAKSAPPPEVPLEKPTVVRLSPLPPLEGSSSLESTD
uniref:Protein kinase domain-containing protein n=1 Tax=Oryza brachyantha TaxID=4533 RepID=J3LV71_ORYBR